MDTTRTVRAAIYVSDTDGTVMYRHSSQEVDISTAGTDSIVLTAATDTTSEVLYTSAGELDDDPPPAFWHIAWHGERLWGIMAENRKELRCSKLTTPGVALAFNAALRVLVEQSSGLTALASMDGSLFAFDEHQVFAIPTDGPDNAGANGSFGEPRLVSTHVGCIDPRSVVTTPRGILFQSRKGIHLLPRGAGAVVYIGDPVKDAVSTYPNIIGAVHDERAHRVTMAAVETDPTPEPQTKWVVSAEGETTVSVPSWATSATIKAWGAGGGGGGGGAGRAGGDGGAGGFIQGTFDVSAVTDLVVAMGQGGSGGDYGGTGDGGNGGGGGGDVVVYAESTGGTKLIQAAGGGGGGGGDDGAGGSDGDDGGAGGGETGETGSGTIPDGGTGGSQSAVGTGGSGYSGNDGTDGSGAAGGDGGRGTGASGTGGGGGGGTGGSGDGGDGGLHSSNGGGGGGGGAGYYGGGGGGGLGNGAGGGGGSSYAVSSATNVTSTAGSGTTPGNDGDEDYGGLAGVPGTGGTVTNDGTDGNKGRVVVEFAGAGAHDNNAKLLVWEYQIEPGEQGDHWFLWDAEDYPNSLAINDDAVAYSVDTSSLGVYEADASYTDGSSGQYTSTVETGSLRFSGMARDNRVWEVYVLGEFRAATTLTVSASYDDGQSYPESKSWSLTGSEGDAVQLRWQPRTQSAKSFRYKITQTGTTEGIRLSGLQILVGVERGFLPSSGERGP